MELNQSYKLEDAITHSINTIKVILEKSTDEQIDETIKHNLRVLVDRIEWATNVKAEVDNSVRKNVVKQ